MSIDVKCVEFQIFEFIKQLASRRWEGWFDGTETFVDLLLNFHRSDLKIIQQQDKTRSSQLKPQPSSTPKPPLVDSSYIGGPRSVKLSCDCYYISITLLEKTTERLTQWMIPHVSGPTRHTRKYQTSQVAVEKCVTSGCSVFKAISPSPDACLLVIHLQLTNSVNYVHLSVTIAFRRGARESDKKSIS